MNTQTTSAILVPKSPPVVENEEVESFLKHIVVTTPPAKDLFYNMRFGGYKDEQEAIREIVDNSLEWSAGTVQINYDVTDSAELSNKGKPKKELSTIYIADDGEGMDRDGLVLAMTPHRHGTHSNSTDFGHFGAGLFTSALSMGRRIEVITKKENEELLKAVFDIDWYTEGKLESFGAQVMPANQEDYELWNRFHGRLDDEDSGTVVAISKLDKLTTNDPDLLTKRLTSERGLGRTYRRYVDNGIQLKVRKTVVKSFDPLMWNDPNTEQVLGPLTICIDGVDVTLRASILPGASRSKRAPQEITWIASGREILHGNDSIKGIWSKHANSRGFVAEISFNFKDGLDLFNVSHRKNDVVLSQSILDILQVHLKPLARSWAEKQKRADSKLEKNTVQEVFAKQSKKLKEKARFMRAGRPAPSSNSGAEGSISGKNKKDEQAAAGTSKRTQTPKMFSPGWSYDFEEVNWTDMSVMANSSEVVAVDGRHVLKMSINMDHPHVVQVKQRDASGQAFAQFLDYISSFFMAQYQLSDSTAMREAVDAQLNQWSKTLATLTRP
tara:strand:- start:675 stop:2336 length:1662 start_codon:yes stop_codon:yes gene_type:complete